MCRTGGEDPESSPGIATEDLCETSERTRFGLAVKLKMLEADDFYE